VSGVIDPLRTSAEELAERLAARDVSCVEVATAYLDRIAELDPELHVYLHVDPARTLADAARIDAAIWTFGCRLSAASMGCMPNMLAA